jgi:hypothetical protein
LPDCLADAAPIGPETDAGKSCLPKVFYSSGTADESRRLDIDITLPVAQM